MTEKPAASYLIWPDHLRRDLLYALGSLRRQSAVAAAVVLTIALAIAANASLFTIFDELLFRPLIYKDADRLVALTRKDPIDPKWPELAGRVRASPLFSGATGANSSLSLFDAGSGDAEAWGLHSADVWPEAFPLLGVPPIAGRWLAEEDVGASNPMPIMISEDLWRTRFGADPSLIGRTISLPGVKQDETVLLVGVLPREFSIPAGANVWELFWPAPSGDGGRRGVPTYARLAPGVALARARGAFPELQVTPLTESARPKGASALTLLMAATVLLLIVAWVQVAALIFARSAARATELGIRLALGATRSALVRQFAVEGAVIAVGALAVATALMPALTALLVWLLPPELTAGHLVTPHSGTFLFAAALSCVGILVIGLVPVELLRQNHPLGLLRGAWLGPLQVSAGRTRAALLVGQLALTATLLYMAGLAVHSFARAMAADLGFEPQHVVAFNLPATAGSLAQYRSDAAFMNDLVATLPTLPGVLEAGAGTRVPLWDLRIATGGRLPFQSAAHPEAEPIPGYLSYASRNYVKALRLRIREGRLPTDEEMGGGRIALANTTLGRYLSQFGPVVGQTVRIHVGAVNPLITIGGVVTDPVRLRPDETGVAEVFVLQDAVRSNEMRSFVARMQEPGMTGMASIRGALDRAYPGQPKTILRLEDALSSATTDYRARSILLGLVALLCLPLAIAGIAGAVFHAVRQQSREIGIRIALGANAHHIRRRIVGRALATVGVGLILGLAGGLGVGKWMSSYLYGVTAIDPVTIAGVAVLLVFAGWASALGPAYRASTIDPSVVLRDS